MRGDLAELACLNMQFQRSSSSSVMSQRAVIIESSSGQLFIIFSETVTHMSWFCHLLNAQLCTRFNRKLKQISFFFRRLSRRLYNIKCSGGLQRFMENYSHNTWMPALKINEDNMEPSTHCFCVFLIFSTSSISTTNK